MKKLLTLTLLVFGALALAQLELVPSSSVEYTASDPSGRWSGRAPVAELRFKLEPDNIRAAQLSVTVKPGKFDSGNFIRDANARRAVFETGQYPDIRFALLRVQTPSNRLDDGDTLAIELYGTLTMHGVTQNVKTTATVNRAGATVTATGTFTVALSDYGMKRPSLFGVEVDDTVQVTFDVQAQGLP